MIISVAAGARPPAVARRRSTFRRKPLESGHVLVWDRLAEAQVIKQALWAADGVAARMEVDGMEITMVLHLPRDAASVPVSRQVLDGCLHTLGVMPDTRADIALALTEACANVVKHAGPGDEYHVQVSTGNRRCVIEVVNAGTGTGGEQAGRTALNGAPVPATAEQGRGLKIINAVVDNLELTGNERQGTTVRFEKKLEWLPGAAGQQLFNGDGGG
jgi:serine/threonine-protein kinase RsbW